jgi:pSer/pThr/pTyr-binding forkhead associated (FHA) protein
MPARLIIESDIDGSRQEVSFDRPRITIGRKPGNDLHFNRPEISGSHAAFLLENDSYYVTDLGSTNGTLLNGAPIVAKEKYPLSTADVVTIAPFRIRFEGEPGATIMEAFPPEAASLRRPSGTEPNLGQRTGTAEHEKEPPAAAAPPPPPPTDPDPPAVEEVAPEPAKEKAEAPKVQEDVSAAPAVEVKEKGGFEIYIWLGFGAIFVLLAIGLIVLLIGL